MKLVAALVTALVATSATGQKQYENFSKVDPTGAWEHAFQGNFSQSATVAPSATIFAYMWWQRQNKYASLNSIVYSFGGRTGERTFDMIRSEKRTLSRVAKEERIPVFFGEDGTFDFDMATIIPGCQGFPKFQIKILKLQGNQLEAQTLVPACVKQ